MGRITASINTNRTFGVEIEFFGVSARTVIQKMKNRGLVCNLERYNHNTPLNWKIVTDASVQGASRSQAGLELVSPVLSGEEGMRQLALALQALRVAGAEVNRTCGIHVHVGAGDLEFKRLQAVVKQMVRDEPLLDLFLDPTRLNNYYCQSNLTTAGRIATKAEHDETVKVLFSRIDNASNPAQLLYAATGSCYGRERYHKLNLAAYARQGTIEFRAKEATLEGDEVMAWVKMVVELTQWASRKTAVQVAANTYASTRQIALRMLKKVSPDVAEYYGEKLRAGMRGRA